MYIMHMVFVLLMLYTKQGVTQYIVFAFGIKQSACATYLIQRYPYQKKNMYCIQRTYIFYFKYHYNSPLPITEFLRPV